MKSAQFKSLIEGDIVRNDGNAFVVVYLGGNHVRVIRVVDISNHKEWLLGPKEEPFDTINRLDAGDLLLHKLNGNRYTVVHAAKEGVTAVDMRVINKTDLKPWKLVRGQDQKK